MRDGLDSDFTTYFKGERVDDRADVVHDDVVEERDLARLGIGLECKLTSRKPGGPNSDGSARRLAVAQGPELG